MELSDTKLVERLSEAGLLVPEQHQKALERQQQTGTSLQACMIALGFVDEDTVVSLALAQSDISHIRLKNYPIQPECLRQIPRDRCLTYTAIPVALEGDLLTVAISDPFNVIHLDDLKAFTKRDVLFVYAHEDDILQAIQKHYPKDQMSMTDVIDKIDTTYASAPAPVAAEPAEDREDSPVVVVLASKIVEEAYHQGASDIHIEHQEDQTCVRYRIDGQLKEALTLPVKVRRALVSRFKIMANLNIAEKRLPQDGRILYKNFSTSKLDIDIRINTMPTAWGEKAVMRLLDKRKEAASLDLMGFLPETLDRYRALIRKPWGMILHVGPTGSGKTTTLYAALAEINAIGTNIQTAEDPIEYLIPRINQSQMNPEIGLTFASALRAFLRQDPDVIMVGEIRDAETAKIATEAALTGHLLFSTLHTNDAVQTIMRITEMGVEPFLVSATLLGVCAQRLMRQLCRCKLKTESTEEERGILKGIEAPFLYKARGCSACHQSGYKGRIGVHELMVMTDELRHAINRRTPALELKRIAVAQGMRSLRQDALRKAAEGITSLDEAIQTVGIEE